MIRESSLKKGPVGESPAAGQPANPHEPSMSHLQQ
jgi:hypothetical protein